MEVHEIIYLHVPDRPRITEKCVELWEKGCSLREIAKLIGRSRTAIRSHLHRAGIETQVPIEPAKITAWRKRRHINAHPRFGFRYHIGAFVPDPREQEILILMSQLASDGLNMNAIAQRLNSLKLKPRRAKKWSRNTVTNILKGIKSENADGQL